jgi:hypothetical protein
MAQDYMNTGAEPEQPHTSIHLPRFIDRKTLLTTAGTLFAQPGCAAITKPPLIARTPRRPRRTTRHDTTRTASLFEEVTVEEPTYKEVVLLFKKKKNSSSSSGEDQAHGKPDENAIFIQRSVFLVCPLLPSAPRCH